jgi:hypothetical protein
MLKVFSEMVKSKINYMGVLLEEMSKEDLIKLVEDLTVKLYAYSTPEAIRARALGRVEMMKREQPE